MASEELILILLRIAEEGAANVDKVKAQLGSLGAEGDAAGASMAGGMKRADEASAKLADSGDLERVGSKLDMLGQDALGAGANMAGGLGGASRAAEKLGSDTEEAAKKVEGHTSLMSKLLSGLGNTASNVGIPFSGALTDAGKAASGASGEVEGLASSAGAMALPLAAAGALIVGIGAESINLADKYQQATATLSANADISTKAANAIGSAFLSTAGKTTFSAQAMMTAYSGVAAELASTQGNALDSAQAMQVMSAAMDLAEGSGTDLTTATAALGQLMQGFGIQAKGAADASNVLFNASRDTGNGVQQVAQQFARMHSQLGSLTPSVDQLGGLLVDLAHHGETGRVGLTAVSTAVSTLLSKGTNLTLALSNQKAAFNALSLPAQALVKDLDNGTISQKQYTAAVATLDTTNQTALKSYTSLTNKVGSAQSAVQSMGITAINAQGQFVGMTSVIAQLSKELHGQTQEQQLADLQAVFGASANRKLLDVVLAGPAAYERYTAQVSAAGSAHAAAAKMADTFHGQLEVLGSTLEDTGVQIGQALVPWLQKLIPIIETLVKWVATATIYLLQHKMVLIAVAAAILGPIAAIAALVVAIIELATHWKVVWGEIEKIAEQVWHFLDGVWQSIGNAALTVWGGILNYLKTVWDTIASTATSIFDSVVRFFVGIWDAVRSGVETAWDWVKDHLGVIIPVIVGIITGPIGLLVALLATHWNTIKADAIKAWNDIESFLSGIFSTIYNDALHYLGELLSFVERVPKDILGVFADAPTLLYEIGKQILEGLAKGIEDAAGGVLHTAVSVVKGIVGGIGHALGIGSPSRVMAEQIGLPIMQGWAQGIDNNVHLATTAATNAARAVVGAAKTGPVTPAGAGAGGVGSTQANLTLGTIEATLEESEIVLRRILAAVSPPANTAGVSSAVATAVTTANKNASTTVQQVQDQSAYERARAIETLIREGNAMHATAQATAKTRQTALDKWAAEALGYSKRLAAEQAAQLASQVATGNLFRAQAGLPANQAQTSAQMQKLALDAWAQSALTFQQRIKANEAATAAQQVATGNLLRAQAGLPANQAQESAQVLAAYARAQQAFLDKWAAQADKHAKTLHEVLTSPGNLLRAQAGLGPSDPAQVQAQSRALALARWAALASTLDQREKAAEAAAKAQMAASAKIVTDTGNLLRAQAGLPANQAQESAQVLAAYLDKWAARAAKEARADVSKFATDPANVLRSEVGLPIQNAAQVLAQAAKIRQAAQQAALDKWAQSALTFGQRAKANEAAYAAQQAAVGNLLRAQAGLPIQTGPFHLTKEDKVVKAVTDVNKSVTATPAQIAAASRPDLGNITKAVNAPSFVGPLTSALLHAAHLGPGSPATSTVARSNEDVHKKLAAAADALAKAGEKHAETSTRLLAVTETAHQAVTVLTQGARERERGTHQKYGVEAPVGPTGGVKDEQVREMLSTLRSLHSDNQAILSELRNNTATTEKAGKQVAAGVHGAIDKNNAVLAGMVPGALR